MNNKTTISGLLVIGTLLFSCKDNNTFSITGTLKNPSKLKTVYLLQADSAAQYKVIDSARLTQDGGYKFKRSAAYVNLYKLRADTNQFDLIAQNGDEIQLNTDLNDSHHVYTISGSEASEKIKAYNDFTKAYTEKNNKVAAEFEAKSKNNQQQSDSLLHVYMPLFQKNMTVYSDMVLKFISDNKNSLAAFDAANALDVVKYEPQLIAYADGINGDLTKNPAVQNFIRTMAKAKPLSIGHKAPDFTINSIDGKPVKLADYKGKYVMIDFWASWCIPCRQENPNVVKQYHHFKSKGFDVLGISLDKEKGVWQKAVNADQLAWTQTSDLTSFDGAVEQLYHIQAIPSNFIIDPQGNIVAKNIRGAELEAFLTKTIH
ncbi:TlpA disulfide reductase family protein [Pedobacter sp. L105]|uniref:TlpA disulfide reductase family protein n=1 Tax=Pedobacter sp. L105 TaxID=1641871 RepID=UPI00131D4E97|nr:TlpA disulfide reductase family protein [Pedobacter sp. L105]